MEKDYMYNQIDLFLDKEMKVQPIGLITVPHSSAVFNTNCLRWSPTAQRACTNPLTGKRSLLQALRKIYTQLQSFSIVFKNEFYVRKRQ